MQSIEEILRDLTGKEEEEKDKLDIALIEEKLDELKDDSTVPSPEKTEEHTDLKKMRAGNEVYFELKSFEAVTATRTGQGIKDIIKVIKERALNN